MLDKKEEREEKKIPPRHNDFELNIPLKKKKGKKMRPFFS